MDQKKRARVFLGIASILMFGGLGYIWMWGGSTIWTNTSYNTGTGSANQEINTPIGYVSAVDGLARIKRSTWDILAAVQLPIYRDDIISTSESWTIEIFYSDNTFFRLGGSSGVRIEWANILRLDGWSVWARITQNPSDTQPFKVVAGDSAMEITGTAAYVKKTDGGLEFAVVDSITSWSGAARIIHASAAGSYQESLGVEESFTISSSGGTTKKLKFSMTRILQDPFVRNNLKSDIVLLDMIAHPKATSSKQPIPVPPPAASRIPLFEKELSESLPKSIEVEAFFTSPVIAKEARQLPIVSNNLSWNFNLLSMEDQSDLLVRFVEEDLWLEKMRQELIQKRTTAGEFSTEEAKLEFQKSVNSLDENIREFDRNWMRLQKQRMEGFRRNATRGDVSSGNETPRANETSSTNGVSSSGGTTSRVSTERTPPQPSPLQKVTSGMAIPR